MTQFSIQHWKISANGYGPVLKWAYPNFFWPSTVNNQLNQISMRQIHLNLTIKTPAWPRVLLLYNIVYMLSIELIVKLEAKYSRNIHQENIELRKSWLNYLIFVRFFVQSVCKIRVLFSQGFGSGSWSNF